MLQSIPCQIYRGGTSKGVFFAEKDLPPAGPVRDNAILAIMGSPDVRQIDGLGGSVSTTSKIAIIAPSKMPGCDVDYTFGQVSLDVPLVDYKSNCGNILSAVGPYAVDNGLVPAAGETTLVRIYNTNTKKVINSYVPTPGGVVEYAGDCVIPGVPGSAAPIRIAFVHPAGAVTGRLLPTGSPRDILEVPGLGKLEVSFVDSTNPLVFVRASDLGLAGCELPDQIDGDKELSALLETIRGVAAVRLGFLADRKDSVAKSPAVPKLTLVSPPMDYPTVSGGRVRKEDCDIVSRMMSMQRAHKTHAFSGALCEATAAAVPGTIVQEIVGPGRTEIRLGHTDGVMIAGVTLEEGEGGLPGIREAYGLRTARRLMTGTAYYLPR